MRFSEGCSVVLVEAAVKRGAVLKYLKTLMSVAKETPTYVVIHPVTIPIKVRGIKRLIAIAPGSAVVCDERVERFSTITNYVELSEPAWIDCGLLIPFATELGAEWLANLGIDEDREVGIALRCVGMSEGEELIKAFKDIVEGGMVIIQDPRKEEVEGEIFKEPRMNVLFMMLKAFDVKGVAKARVVMSLTVDERIKYFVNTVAKIGGREVVLSVGKGYAILFEPLDNNSLTLASVTALASMVVPTNSPRAKLYLSRLVR